MSLFRIDPATGAFFIDAEVVRMVPELKRLQDQRGQLALQYLYFWCRPYGPYTRLSVEADKDRAVTTAVNQLPAILGQRLSEGLCREKVFQHAAAWLSAHYKEEDPTFKRWQMLRRKHDQLTDGVDKVDPMKPVKGVDLKELLSIDKEVMKQIDEMELSMAQQGTGDEFEVPGETDGQDGSVTWE